MSDKIGADRARPPLRCVPVEGGGVVWTDGEPIDEHDGDWVDCWNCGGDGEIEDEDWQFAGDFYQCDICDGKGGWPRSSDPFHDEDVTNDV